MEMIRNPNMFNEMMRNHDQAIRNLQGIPGGEAALQRLYSDIQEPLLNSANSGANPFASNNDTNAESRSQRAGVENAEALPNPWGGGGARATAGSDNNASTGAAAGAGGLGGALGGMNMASMMNNPALQSMMSSPEMQETMRSMMSNPEMMRTLMSPEMIQQARGLMGDNIGSNDDIARMAEQMSGLVIYIFTLIKVLQYLFFRWEIQMLLHHFLIHVLWKQWQILELQLKQFVLKHLVFFNKCFRMFL